MVNGLIVMLRLPFDPNCTVPSSLRYLWIVTYLEIFECIERDDLSRSFGEFNAKNEMPESI
jgi:hypothetical protein